MEEKESGGCSNCNGPLEDGVMPEEGVDWPILRCTRCSWWGSRWDWTGD